MKRRMQSWDARMIAFMRDAEAHNAYTRALAEWILPHLNADDAVCEAGCGLGQLALALAGAVRSYTAFDRNADALRDLREAAKSKNNLRVACAELESFQPDESTDVLLLCLFGGGEEIFTAAERMQCGRIIEIARRTSDELWNKNPNGLDADALPKGWRIASKESKALPLNQPFRSFEEAREFADLYLDEGITDAELKAMLRPIQTNGFSFELPVTRNLEMRVYNRK